MKYLNRFLTVSLPVLALTGVFVSAEYQEPPSPAAKQEDIVAALRGTPSLWRDPGDIASLNLIYGAGSPDREPSGTLTFVKEDTAGATPKFEVVDQRGVHWKVKLGKEAQSETAATRLLWAAGYFVDEAYYRPEIRVERMPRLVRGREFVSGDIVRTVRLEPVRKPEEFIGNWSWSDTHFTGAKAMSGLRIMMALINNWDLKSANNTVYAVAGEAPRYVVSDLGASFGKTGGIGSRTKSDLQDYADSQFIDKTDLEKVDLKIKSRPFFLLAVDPYHYNKLAGREKVGRDIPRADARWLGGLLSRLSVEQIRDAFRAAGYSPADVFGFANVVTRRIAELSRL
jgi:hypothetical protein